MLTAQTGETTMTDQTDDRPAPRPWSHIGLYLVLTAALSSIFYAFILITGQIGAGRGVYVAGLMWSPGVAAILTCLLTRTPLASLGWKWGQWKWQWAAFLIPLAYALVAYTVVWTMGWGGVVSPAFLEHVRKDMGWLHVSDAVVVGGYVLLMGVVGMVASCAHALGEEIGWRGFLAPSLVRKIGFWGGAIVTGLIWTAWHVPVLLFSVYNNGTQWWYGLGCFTVLVVSISVVMTWLRMRSGSLWTGMLAHASHNLLIQAILTPMTFATGAITPYAIDEFGFAVPAMALLTAILVVVFARKPLDAPAT
jgi:membrane protease YdiL (CAAX protease family)